MARRSAGGSALLGVAGVAAALLGVATLAWPNFWIEPVQAAWAIAWAGLLALALRSRNAPEGGTPVAATGDPLARSSLALALIRVGLFALGVSTCALVASRSVANVPSIHDEWSYLFQAETFLAGRFWLPSDDAIPGLFDQIHVLNEGRFASRYFPGTGLWLAPFVALGHPLAGQWLAAGAAAVLLFETGRALAGPHIGLVAGLLVALAPGVAGFCNLLVAHAPTLLGIALFLCGFARADAAEKAEESARRPRVGWALASGSGLALAMVCRPLTAAAIGLPFGLVLVGRLARALRTRAPRPARRLIATGLPIAAGLGLLAAHDVAITGHVAETPYGLYNTLHTPRHVYGFANGTRGEAAALGLVDRDLDYDRWARNLDADLAVRNVRARLKYSLKAWVGAVPFVAALLAVTLGRRRSDPFWLACLASIALLHAVHVPYWFAGIDGYHYVFESLPLYALVFAGSVQVAGSVGRTEGRPWLATAWTALALVPAVWQWLPMGAPLQTQAGLALQRGTSVEASRGAFARFARLVDERVTTRPALVLVRQPPVDLHVDYVVNPPTLDAPVLFGRFDPARMQVEAIAAAFPDRALYLFDERGRRFERVQRAFTAPIWYRPGNGSHGSARPLAAPSIRASTRARQDPR